MNGEQATHPARATLAAFGSGKLDPAEAVAVEAHIAECEECCETLHGLGNDTFVDLVRQSNAVQLSSADGTVALPETQSESVSDLPHELTDHPRYRVLELLGRGGMGDVYRAEHTLMNRSVALKLISRDLVQNARAVERFRREVQSAAQLAHPNIVTAYDAEQAGDVHFFVMEYVPGEDLSDVVKRQGPLDVDQACDYIRQAAEGLQHAHDRGMVHRDVKPQNLMVAAEGQQVKILDFGLAALANEAMAADAAYQQVEDVTNGRPRAQLTSAGSMMGTPDFIAPEQAIDARAADVRSDIYSLGCTFYYLLTGRPPFTDGSALERVKAHGELEPESIEKLRTDIPAELAAIVRRMMAKDPAERFQTPADVAEALVPFVDTPRPMPAPSKVAEPRRSTAASRRSWLPPAIATLLALAACVLAGVIYVATDNGTLVVESEDENVEIVIRSGDGLEIMDTVTGSTAKRLRSGEYVLDLRGDENRFDVDRERFVLKRGGRVIVKVTRRENGNSAGVKASAVASRDPSMPNQPNHSFVLRRVFLSEGAPRLFGEVFPDGRRMSMVDWENNGNLAIRDFATGKVQRVTHNKNWFGGYAYFSKPSRDGKRIACCWPIGDTGHCQLRVIDVATGEYQLLYENKDGAYLEPRDWFPNGDSIVAVVSTDVAQKQLVQFSLNGSGPRVLKSLDWRWPETATVSPDGRYLAYDVQLDEDSADRDVFIMATDGSDEFQMEHPAIDSRPVWTPDGKGVVFTSDRGGSEGLWYQELIDSKPSDAPRLLVANMKPSKPVGLTWDGTYFFHTDFDTLRGDVYVDMLNGSGRDAASARMAIQHDQGFNAQPRWSPDGAFLAYRMHETIVVQAAGTGRERQLRLSPPVDQWHRHPLRWTHDGRFVVVAGKDVKGRWGLYTVDAQTGAVSPMVQGPWDKFFIGGFELSPDGKSVYYLSYSGMEIIEHDLATQRERTVYRPSAIEVATDGVGALIEQVKRKVNQQGAAHVPPNVIHSLAISPDGRQLAFATHKTIGVLSLADGTRRVLFQAQAEEVIPANVGIAWRQLDNSLIFARCEDLESYHPKARAPVSRLWKVSVDDQAETDLGVEIDGLTHLTLHPDGQQIAYTKVPRHGGAEIWALENFLPPREGDEPTAIASTVTPGAPSMERLSTGHGTISPDKTKVCLPENETFVVKDRSTGDTVTISEDFRGSSEYPVWSHDSQWFAHEFLVGEDGNQCQIRIASPTDGTVKQLPSSDHKRLIIQDWSPDGQSILCVARNQDETWALVVISVDPYDIRQLQSFGWDLVGHARYSPDGRFIAFERWNGAGPMAKVYVYDTVENDVRRLSDSPEAETHPVWSADGRHILFTSDDNLRVIAFDKDRPARSSRLIQANWGDFGIRLSTSGELLFKKYNMFTDVYVSDVSAESVSPPRRVSRSRGLAVGPTFSPDGKRIAYIVEGGVLKIRSLDNGATEAVKTGLSYIQFVHWSPDGKTLAIGPGYGNDPIGVSLFSLDTTELKLLIPFSSDRERRIQPKGFTSDGQEFVVYVHDVSDWVVTEHFAYDVETGERRKIEFPQSNPPIHKYDFSRDGKRIAYVTSEGESLWKLIVSDVGFQNEITIAEQQGSPNGSPSFDHPRWSPDGTKLLFFARTGRAKGGKELRLCSSDGSWQATLDVGNLKHWWRPEVAPAWSPDGNQLVYSLTEGPIVETWVLRNYQSALADEK